MEIQVIIFSVLLAISNSVFSTVQPLQGAPNQKQFHEVNYAAYFPIENFKRSQSQFNVPDNLNNQHLYQQNNKPVKPPLNVFQTPLPIREGIQINHKPNVQQKNLRPNNFLMRGINERNSQIQQNLQSQITKPIENRHLILPRSRDTFMREIPYRRVENVKEASTPIAHRVVPGITKIDLTNVPERGPVKQQYISNLVSLHNINNVSHLGNNNNNIHQQKNLLIQQPVPQKRYTLIRKNGAIEHYDNLEVLLKKYPQVKLPPNIGQVTPSQIAGVNKDLKNTANIRSSLVTNKPYSNINISLNTFNNDNVVQNRLQHPTNLQKQSLENTAKIPDKIKDERHVSFSDATKLKVNHNTRNPIAEKSVIDLMHAGKNLSDKIKLLPNQGLNAKTNLSGLKEIQNKIYTPHSVILSDQTESVNEKSVTNAPSTNVPNQVKSAVLSASVVNKFGKPINSTVDPKINTDSEENKTTEASTFGHDKSSLDSKSESINKLNPNTTAIDPKFLSRQKMAKKQFETNITYIESVSSTPAITSNVTKSTTTSNCLEQKEIHKIADKTTLGHDYKDNNEDSWLPNKPVMWFTTNDPNFWDKLVDDSTNSYVYIINVQSHPKIEKDTKTVVHANGTIVEEITESIWENDCDEPKITKTVNIIPAADITKDKIVAEH